MSYKQNQKIGPVRELNAWTLSKSMIRTTTIDVLNLLEQLEPYNIEHQNPKEACKSI